MKNGNVLDGFMASKHMPKLEVELVPGYRSIDGGMFIKRYDGIARKNVGLFDTMIEDCSDTGKEPSVE